MRKYFLIGGVAIIIVLSIMDITGMQRTDVPVDSQVEVVQAEENATEPTIIPIQPTPVPTPKSTPESTPKSIPESTAKSTPESTSKSTLESTPEPTIEAESSSSSKYLGKFRITRYCRCEICCGQWAGGPTASGTSLTDGRTIAVDKSVIPLGTHVYIEGIGERVAEDTGGAIKGNHIDLFCDVSHNEALKRGVTYNDVYIID